MADQFGPGGRFPDLELPDHSGNPRRLSELAAGDPLLLHFYRGFWCPKEQAFFRRLVRLQDEAEVAYTRFVSVSVDSPETAAAFRAGLGARWTFLSDAERRYQAELGLRETTDRVHRPYLPGRCRSGELVLVPPEVAPLFDDPAGPAIQRYSGKPWPAAGFDTA